MTEKKTIVIGVTGGIAAYKVTDLVSRLKKRGFEVEVMMTEAAQELVAPLTFRVISGRPVRLDLFDESEGDPAEVEHIAIADRADLIVIVPATANIMAKAAAGIADDLVSTVILAADSPVLYFPAMNTRMWEHPATQNSVAVLRERGFKVVDPAEGRLACGTVGRGRLPDIETLEEKILAVMAESEGERDYAGKTVLITAGPTEEPIDPVRCITNHSSGKMGCALAKAALRRGAEVHLVCGPIRVDPPAGVRVYPVRTALEMKAQTEALYDAADVTIMAAAVADYRVKDAAAQKIKKDGSTLTLELTPNPDILASLGERKHGVLVGFAAETERLAENARRKLEQKHVDMIVANDVSPASGVFGGDTNTVAIFRKNGATDCPKMTKDALADVILDEIKNLEETKE